MSIAFSSPSPNPSRKREGTIFPHCPLPSPPLPPHALCLVPHAFPMLSLTPTSVSLLSHTLDQVDAVAIDRRSGPLAEERTDNGPHLVFADAPEQRVTVSITRTLTRDEPTLVRPGDMGELRLTTAPSASDAQRRTIAATVVVTSVEHDFVRRDQTTVARQRLALLALSPDGHTDPITETLADAH